MNSTLSYVLALSASACFSSASLVFAEFSRRISPLWMNVFKAALAWLCFGLAIFVSGGWTPLEPRVFGALFASGILGLGIGDIFLLTAYARMGAARTLILYGFQPLFLGVAAHFLFNQDLSWMRLLAVLFFVACLFVFSLERYRQEGRWEILGLVAALAGVILDNTGVLMSRWSFDQVAGLSVYQANFVRCTGALFIFACIGRVKAVNLAAGWRGLNQKNRFLVAGASVLGCFVSLVLYLSAIRIGHLASISALGVAGPIFTAGLECAVTRKPPSRYLIVALLIFIAGFAVLSWA